MLRNENHFRAAPEANQAAVARDHRVVLPSLMSTIDTSRCDEQHRTAMILDKSVIATVEGALNAML